MKSKTTRLLVAATLGLGVAAGAEALAQAQPSASPQPPSTTNDQGMMGGGMDMMGMMGMMMGGGMMGPQGPSQGPAMMGGGPGMMGMMTQMMRGGPGGAMGVAFANAPGRGSPKARRTRLPQQCRPARRWIGHVTPSPSARTRYGLRSSPIRTTALATIACSSRPPA